LAQSHHAPDASTQGGYTQPKNAVTAKYVRMNSTNKVATVSAPVGDEEKA
jgi:hypothetical protein